MNLFFATAAKKLNDSPVKVLIFMMPGGCCSPGCQGYLP